MWDSHSPGYILQLRILEIGEQRENAYPQIAQVALSVFLRNYLAAEVLLNGDWQSF
jgi:hypothetical protein